MNNTDNPETHPRDNSPRDTYAESQRRVFYQLIPITAFITPFVILFKFMLTPEAERPTPVGLGLQYVAVFLATLALNALIVINMAPVRWIMNKRKARSARATSESEITPESEITTDSEITPESEITTDSEITPDPTR